VVDGEKPEVDFREIGLLEGTIGYSWKKDDVDEPASVTKDKKRVLQ